MSEAFKHSRKVSFHETDLMGVVHHANYLKFFEDARVEWMQYAGLVHIHVPFTENTLAVLKTEVQHLSPCRFLDSIDVFLQVRLSGLKFEFQYAIYDDQKKRKIAVGASTHVLLNKDLKPLKLTSDFKGKMEKWTWTETWL